MEGWVSDGPDTLVLAEEPELRVTFTWDTPGVHPKSKEYALLLLRGLLNQHEFMFVDRC